MKDLISFSDCGQYLVYCGTEGKLRIWDTFSGTLKQEYAPNLHLNSPCTCLTWVSLSEKSINQNPKRKRKLKGKTTKVIVFGTDEGTLAVYSLAEAKIISTLKDGNSNNVRGVSWSRDGGIFSVDGTYAIHWDLENKSVRSKWKCKGSAMKIGVSPNGELCITGNINICLWDVKSQKCLRTFTGHSNELSNLIFINDNYFLSNGINDRHIAAWTTNSDDDKPIGRFSVGDNVSGELSVLLEDKTSLHMVATTVSGGLFYFNQQLNGKVLKTIKPIQRIELVDNENESNSTNTIPVACGQLRTSSTISVAYGHSPIFGFETLSISLESDKQIIRVLKPTAKQIKIVSTNCVGNNEANENVEYTNRVTCTTGVKRKLAGGNEVTMEERLGNLCIDMKDVSGVASTSVQNPHNLSHLLVQGLDSKDKSILDSVLLRRDPKVINETVSRLPVHALVPLVMELKRMMQGRTFGTIVATDWLKAVIRDHGSQVLADSSIQGYLTSVQSIIEGRLCLMGPLGALSGRLRHILQQLDSDSQSWRNLADSLEPVVLYQDQDSSDEGGSIIDGDYESEDKWDELSDEQVDSEPSS